MSKNSIIASFNDVTLDFSKVPFDVVKIDATNLEIKLNGGVSTAILSAKKKFDVDYSFVNTCKNVLSLRCDDRYYVKNNGLSKIYNNKVREVTLNDVTAERTMFDIENCDNFVMTSILTKHLYIGANVGRIMLRCENLQLLEIDTKILHKLVIHNSYRLEEVYIDIATCIHSLELHSCTFGQDILEKFIDIYAGKVTTIGKNQLVLSAVVGTDKVAGKLKKDKYVGGTRSDVLNDLMAKGVNIKIGGVK
jgi:hypothetical protein